MDNYGLTKKTNIYAAGYFVSAEFKVISPFRKENSLFQLIRGI